VRRALVPLLVLAALAAGITLGGHPTLLPGPVRDALVGDQDSRVVREAIEKVHDDYYREIPERRLADAAIKGIVRSLDDRFSHYLTAEEYEKFKDVTHSRYEGVGMEVRKADRGLRVVNVYDDSPAKRAGIEPGDVVLAADGTSLEGKDAARASAIIKGPPGTEVRLRILHDGRTRTLRVSRARVTVPVVASRLREVRGDKLGVVRLATFSSGAHAEVRRALRRLLHKGAEGIVLDLRGNGGGLVTEAQLIASAFLDGGTVVTTKGRASPKQVLRAKGEPVVPKDVPVVVLVDGNTASASEIVTGALQDRGRATVVGTKTFGKGVFQEIIDLSNGGALDITAGQYFTPSGRNLGGRGVHTGAGIEPKVHAKDKPKTKVDEALRTALRVLAGKVD
jgi:carboxyl-terminal processing protease